MKALERYDYFYGDSFKVEFPTGSGNMMRLKDTSVEIATRLSKLFIPDANGRRPCHGDDEIYWKNKNWSDEILFYEFFCKFKIVLFFYIYFFATSGKC